MERTYNTSSINMLIVAEEICGNLKTHLSELEAVRPQWADPYCNDLATRIHKTYTQCLGFDKTKSLRELTDQLKTTHLEATKDITLFIKMLKIDFAGDPKRQKSIILTLGLDTFPVPVKSDQEIMIQLLYTFQEIMIQLLYTFQENMTTALTSELTGKGIPSALINKINTHTDIMKGLDVRQETAKTEKIVLTAEAQTELNAIYKEVIGICSIARTVFGDHPEIQQKFSFFRLLKAMNKPKATTQTEQE